MERRIRSGRAASRRSVFAAIGGLAVAVASAAPEAARAATLHVDDDPDPCSPKDGTIACPYPTIQEGIDAAVVGDEVLVHPGVYLEWIFLKNGVDVLSQGGPLVTTIDATGQNFTAVRFSSTSPTSTVITRLSGFTITGGTGRQRPAASRGTPDGAMAGGGIFTYTRNIAVETPVIENNIITGNQLASSDLTNYPDLLGGGIYVSVGRPRIVNNIISGNTADAQYGANGRLAYGGGIYATYWGRPNVSSNEISGNFATQGGGGVNFQGGPNPRPTLDGNLIAGNTTEGTGAGVLAGSYSRFTVTNNVIRENVSYGIGGAIYTVYADVEIHNNTIVGNTAVRTGGIWIGLSDPDDTVAISNNLITGNISTDALYPYAGGFAARAGTSALIDFTYNDLVDNTPFDWGDVPDPALSPGNISVTPVFENPAGNDYRLAMGSAGIDAGDNGTAPSLDFDGFSRPQDGDGDAVPVVDMGAYERPEQIDSDVDGVPDDGDGSGTPGDNPCTGGVSVGCDDNCPAISNPGQEDFDGDGVGDACDLDIDGDAVENSLDCADFVNSVDSIPGEVVPLQVTLPGAGLKWTFERQSNVFNVYRMGRTAGTPFAYEFVCMASEVPQLSWSDLQDPGVGEAFLYRIAGVNTCGEGPLGFDSLGGATPPASTPCLPQGLDSDSDLVPDLDDNCPLEGNPGQADLDLDGQGDACDRCPGDPTNPDSPAGIGDTLLLSSPGTLSWSPDPLSTSYPVSRGSLSAGSGFAYDYGCVADVTGGETWVDPEVPAPGAAFYYVVEGANSCTTSGPGPDGQGFDRPPPTACPAP